ncbi:hypothetical protein AcW1_009700 [Taiwanofungus camphoratus]|nr:hypothetical protein AcV5_002401 [Antrodia cinnamomea]KAI0948101.1 hypothetical protein AcW1_009700 [Antrodia cinnamomea]
MISARSDPDYSNWLQHVCFGTCVDFDLDVGLTTGFTFPFTMKRERFLHPSTGHGSIAEPIGASRQMDHEVNGRGISFDKRQFERLPFFHFGTLGVFDGLSDATGLNGFRRRATRKRASRPIRSSPLLLSSSVALSSKR